MTNGIEDRRKEEQNVKDKRIILENNGDMFSDLSETVA